MFERMIDLVTLHLQLQRFGFIRWILRAIVIIFLLLALLGVMGDSTPLFFGLFFITLPPGIVMDIFGLFIVQEIALTEAQAKTDTRGINRAAAIVIVRGKQEPIRLWHYLLRDPSTRFVTERLGVSPELLAKSAGELPAVATWYDLARKLAESKQEIVAPEHLFEVVQTAPTLANLWREIGVSDQERQEVWVWWRRIVTTYDQASPVRMSGGVGRDWTSGYTQILEQYARDITKDVASVGQAITLIGHDAERKQVLEYLSRDQSHNVVVIGEEGIGKERMMYTLASDFNRGTVPSSLRYKHLYQLDTGALINGATETELSSRLQAVLNEAAHVGNVIVIVPDFYLLLGAGGEGKVGTIDASAIIEPYLQSSSIQIVALMTPDQYERYVRPRPALVNQLMAVEIKEITAHDALTIVEDEVFRFEKKRLLFTFQSLQSLIMIADQHVHTSPFPEKALQLLDEVASALADEQAKLVMPHDVERILSSKLKVPLGQATTQERSVLENLEQRIGSRIVGQTEAVSTVANAIRRARAGLHSGRRPIGTFLFLGPTGVGKTEMAKTVAAIYYTNEQAFIRVDMTEYQTPESVEKLLGTAETPGTLSTAVTDQPFSVVLLDEIEKADVSVRNAFLHILDEGYATNGFGQRVDFTNTIIIATSNAGAELIRQAVSAGPLDAAFKTHLLDWLQKQGTFSPEWLNRFDSVVVFTPLSKEEIRRVAELQVAELVARLKTHNIELSVASDVYDVLVEKGFDPQFGARPMRRAVQDIIESALAKSLLNDESQGTKRITLTRDML